MNKLIEKLKAEGNKHPARGMLNLLNQYQLPYYLGEFGNSAPLCTTVSVMRTTLYDGKFPKGKVPPEIVLTDVELLSEDPESYADAFRQYVGSKFAGMTKYWEVRTDEGIVFLKNLGTGCLMTIVKA